MRSVILSSFAVAGVLAMSSVASAAVLFSDDFEGAGYNNGDNVATHAPDVGDVWSASTNSLLRNASPSPAGSGGTYYASLNDRIIGYLTSADQTTSNNATIYSEFDFYVSSDTGGHGLNYITFTGWPGYRGPDFLLRPNGTFAYYTNASNVYNTDPNFSFTVGAWQHASLVVNYQTGAASLTVGSQTANFSTADPTNATYIREIDFINYNDNQTVVGVDNIIVSTTPIPEPASLSLVGLGALALRRRK